MTLPASTSRDTIGVPSPWSDMISTATAAARRVMGCRAVKGKEADDVAQELVIEKLAVESTSNQWTAYQARERAKGLLARASLQSHGEPRRQAAGHEEYLQTPEEETPQRGSPWLMDDVLDLRQAVASMPSLLRETVQWWLANGGNQRRAARDMGVSPPTYGRLWDQAKAYLQERLK